ncbi:MAG: hypothetical protein ACJ749_15315 [Flavisolibacter sp.]
MMREIFTLVIDKIPTQYYVQFNKDRQRFFFQAAFKYKTAPSFTIMLLEDRLVAEPAVKDEIAEQALKKVREIVADEIFDRF